jgi:hypothetical protein
MSADHIVKKAQRKEGAMGLRKPATPSCLCALLANGERILFFGFTQKPQMGCSGAKKNKWQTNSCNVGFSLLPIQPNRKPPQWLNGAAKSAYLLMRCLRPQMQRTTRRPNIVQLSP